MLYKHSSEGNLHKRCYENFIKFTVKYLWWNLFLNKTLGLRMFYFKKRLQQKCFCIIFVKFFPFQWWQGTIFFLENLILSDKRGFFSSGQASIRNIFLLVEKKIFFFFQEIKVKLFCTYVWKVRHADKISSSDPTL